MTRYGKTKSWQEELLEARGVKVPKEVKESDRHAMSSKTLCPVCNLPIKRGRDSYSCPAPDFVPRHFRCQYPVGE